MSGSKFLIDTNVVIALEDDRAVELSFARFTAKCSEHGVRLFVHAAVQDDVRRDKDPDRRAVTLSKLQKFEELRPPAQIPHDELVSLFGAIRTENDRSDVLQLAALHGKAVDFFVTQDVGIRKRAERAERAGLGGNVLTVPEALAWIRQTYEPKEVRLPYIVERKAYEINRSDPIFDTLRQGYPGFDQWFEKCVRQHRQCWVVEVGPERELAGIVIRKDERHLEADTRGFGPKILKLCTFKMKSEFRGEKFGEHLLKQILWFAQRNTYDLVYLTAYPDQASLIELLLCYGFEITKTQADGELFLEKQISKRSLEEPNDTDLLSFARRIYPRFYDGAGVSKFCVPIQSAYHRRLFPEIAIPAKELPLFREADSLPIIGYGGDRTPGNTIRKVYLCRAMNDSLRPGDLMFFYMSKDARFRASQSITNIGVVEQVGRGRSTDDLIRMTAKRSVFTANELEQIAVAKPSHVKVIDFLLVGHVDPHIYLPTLQREKVFSVRPPQSIMRLSSERYDALRRHLNLGFGL